MANNDISTNPAVLREVASAIKTYTSCQYETIRSFLVSVSAEQNDIQTRDFHMYLEAINEWLRRMDELKDDAANFASFLENKASELEQF